jgi:Zn-dependent protease with chaperone function
MPRWAVKSLAVGPPVVISAVLAGLVVAALPAMAGLAVLIAVVGGGLLLGLGRGEGAAAALLFASRPLRAGQVDDLAQVLTLLCRAHLGPPAVHLRVRTGRAVVATGFGRRTVVVTSALVDAVGDARLPAEQAAAVIAHAASLVRTGLVRTDPLVAAWAWPWLVLQAGARELARGGRRLPFTTTAWRARVVVVTIAVVQFAAGGHVGFAVTVGAIGALSYAIPVWGRHWDQMLIAAGDRGLAEAGFAPPMVDFLRCCPATSTTRSRLRALRATTPRPAPKLGLVAR